MAPASPGTGGHHLRTSLPLLLLSLLTSGCPSGDPVERLVSQLDDAAHRERAIDGLLVLVRQSPARERAAVKLRVVNALADAYREDTARPQIVSALAILRDPAAEEVFVAALKDVERGGAYFEAAVRSARMLGELGLKKQTPVLVETLKRALAAPRQDRNTWLERSVIQALETLGDRRAVPVLIRALDADPSQVDFYVNRLAARALGRMGDRRAVKPLVDSLGATAHGLLLFEESRRALCRIGPPALDGLLSAAAKRDRRGQPERNAAAAARVIADIGLPRTTAKLAGLVKPRDPAALVLAVAEALLRLGDRGGEALLLDLVKDPRAGATSRRHAAALLGWYGSAEALVPLLRPSCEKPDGPAGQLVCWGVALAVSRVAGARGVEVLDKLLTSMQDKATRRNLEEYRARFELMQTCDQSLDCYREQLATAKSWRQRERAALALGRSGDIKVASALARALPEAHPQVKRAILVALEQLAVQGRLEDVRAALVRTFEQQGKDSDPNGATPPSTISRVLCLAERLGRQAHERADKGGEQQNDRVKR